MAYSFDERVVYAIDHLWLHIHSGKGAQAKEKLEEAVRDGDADACYFLGRCYAGSGFISPEHGLPEDDALAKKYFDMSIERGSAIGMLGGMRLGDYKPGCGSYFHAPYHSLKEVWNKVNEMADAGELFCKMMIANAYYYGDVAKFLDINSKTVPNIEDFVRLEHEWAEKAISMYEYCIAHGLYMVIGNLIDLYTSGDGGIPKQPEKELELRHLGVEMGIGTYEIAMGKEYCEKKQANAAEELFLSALRHGEKRAAYYIGEMYTFRGIMLRNLYTASHYLEEALAAGVRVTSCHNLLGEIYFYGGDGILPDYDRAFVHLLAAYEDDSLWGIDMLGTCYLKGLGTDTDYRKALQMFEQDVLKPMSCIGIGEIYAYGLGVKPDIRSAMVYWNNYPKDERVIANKKNFKHTLFGWKRVDSATGQQWARQFAQQKPASYTQEKEKTEEAIRNNRMEWIDLAAAVFCLGLSVLLIILNVEQKSDSTLIRVIALLLPMLVLFLYYAGILNQNTHSGNQMIAIILFLSSIAALYTALSTGYISYLNYFQFIVPCIAAAVFFLIINSILKRKRDRYLALLIMVIWLPFYMLAFVILLNVTAPSLQVKETSSKLLGTNYHGDESYTVQVQVGEMESVLSFKLPKDIYDRVSYDSFAEVTICKGVLGIDYARVRLENLEELNAEND